VNIAVDAFGPGFADFAISHLNRRKLDGYGSSLNTTGSDTEHQTRDEQRMQVTEAES
jgi:hypothetical protein